MVSQQLIKRDTGPGFLNNTSGKRLIEHIGMSKTAICNSRQIFYPGSAAAIGNTTKKQSIPVSGGIQVSTDLLQYVGIKVFKEDIILKNQDA